MSVRGRAWLLAGSLLCAMPGIAFADDGYRGDSRWEGRDRGRESGAYRRAVDRGYDEGRRRGERDARHGDGFSLYRDDRYRRADAGYHSSYGSRGEYSRAFRRGFEEGYRDGFREYRNGGRGYRDGRVIREVPRW